MTSESLFFKLWAAAGKHALAFDLRRISPEVLRAEPKRENHGKIICGGCNRLIGVYEGKQLILPSIFHACGHEDNFRDYAYVLQKYENFSDAIALLTDEVIERKKKEDARTSA